MGPLITALSTLLEAAAPKHEDLPGGHERFVMFGIPWFDSRRVERRLERRKKRIELRKLRREARAAGKK
ncbi:MAG TPA: hypothetical protein VK524_34470 [Polyangiaceae bacterium]|nr:hypothetical protein [Polyangiaceae bacterium]